MSTNKPVPVLIVGAGPTGLTVANILSRRGVAFRIVERDEGPIDQPRALWVHARTLELWSRLGVLESALAQGRRTETLSILVNGRPRGRMPYRGDTLSPFPYGLVLEQSKTQRILLASLAEQGGAVSGARSWADVAPWLTPLAAAGLAVIMAGAVWTHVSAGQGPQSGVTGLITLLLIVIVVIRWPLLAGAI